MWRFKEALLEHLARPGKRLILKEVCEQVGLEAHRVSRWRRRPGFADWLDQELNDALRRLAAPMHLAQMHQAFTSLPHYEVQLRRLGLDTPWPQTGAPGGGPGGALTQGGVNIFVGIPQREPFESLPPARTLPATPAPTPAATGG